MRVHYNRQSLRALPKPSLKQYSARPFLDSIADTSSTNVLWHNLDLLLVGLGLAAGGGLVNLVANGVLGSGSAVKLMLAHRYKRRRSGISLPSADGGVAVLGNLLVGLLGCTVDGLLNLVADEVGTLLDRLHCDEFGL